MPPRTTTFSRRESLTTLTRVECQSTREKSRRCSDINMNSEERLSLKWETMKMLSAHHSSSMVCFCMLLRQPMERWRILWTKSMYVTRLFHSSIGAKRREWRVTLPSTQETISGNLLWMDFLCQLTWLTMRNNSQGGMSTQIKFHYQMSIGHRGGLIATAHRLMLFQTWRRCVSPIIQVLVKLWTLQW